jgi:hypothetical protein
MLNVFRAKISQKPKTSKCLSGRESYLFHILSSDAHLSHHYPRHSVFDVPLGAALELENLGLSRHQIGMLQRYREFAARLLNLT